MIVLALHLMPARRARGIRNRKYQPRLTGQKPPYQGGLARPGRRGDYEDGGHSRFSDCSRSLSISAFAASARSVMVSPRSPSPPVFDRMVLEIGRAHV